MTDSLAAVFGHCGLESVANPKADTASGHHGRRLRPWCPQPVHHTHPVQSTLHSKHPPVLRGGEMSEERTDHAVCYARVFGLKYQ